MRLQHMQEAIYVCMTEAGRLRSFIVIEKTIGGLSFLPER